MVNNELDKWTSIKIRKSTRTKLMDLGKKYQTYNDIINTLIEKNEKSIIPKDIFIKE